LKRQHLIFGALMVRKDLREKSPSKCAEKPSKFLQIADDTIKKYQKSPTKTDYFAFFPRKLVLI